MIQDWANDNIGSIELSGNLAAVGQRHLVIQKQIEQVAALQSLAEAQRRQQIENALLEERQNVLYDISAALEDIKSAFSREPAKAYFDFLVLEEFVSSLGLEHRMFSSLEWKNHCNKTLAGIGELRIWCDTALDAKYIQAGTQDYRKFVDKLKLAEKQAEKDCLQKQESQMAKELSQEIEKKSARIQFLLIGFGLIFAVAVLYVAFFGNGDIELVAGICGLFFILAMFFIPMVLANRAEILANREKLEKLGK